MVTILLKKPKKLPNFAGVYIFRDSRRRPLYIGKAFRIKSRLSFYFRKEALRHPRIAKLMQDARGLEIIKADSEIEALVKEALLIKRFRPKYNILMRDDKNYIFVVVTKKDFPRLILTHQPKAFSKKIKTIGPFTDATSLKRALKLLRRAFPYCTCKAAHAGLCLNAEIGRCPGFCCNKSVRTTSRAALADYHKNICAIISVLEGKKMAALRAEIKKQIAASSHRLKYEEAAKLRDRLLGLDEILRHREVLRASASEENTSWLNLEAKIKTLLGITFGIGRVEGYDISNISGASATGSMVVFTNGVADKSEYRKFRIKSVKGANDVAMMAETLLRRFNHQEWTLPNLIVLDGGKPQINAAIAALKSQNTKHKLQTLVVALAKRDEELYVAGRKYPIQLKKQPREVLHFFQRVRDEAHRFAQKYHHKLREKEIKNG